MHANLTKYSLIFCVFFLLNCNYCLSQNQNKADSLIKIFKENKASLVQKAMLLESIAYYHPKLDSALYYANESLILAKQSKNQMLIAEAWEQIGHKEKLLGNNTKSLEAAFTALNIYETNKKPEKAAAVYTQIATHYIEEQEFNLAIKYLKNSLAFYQKTNNSYYIALTLINLGEAYRMSGNVKQSELLFLKVIELNNLLKDNLIYGYSLGNLGLVYASKKEWDKASNNLNNAVEILSKMNDDYSCSIYFFELGKIYEKQGSILQAENEILKAFTLAKKAELKEQIRDFSGYLSIFYEKKNDYKKSLEYQRLFQIYQDSLINKNNIKKIEQLKAGYIIGQREVEIKNINTISKNRKNIAILLGTGLFIFTIMTLILLRLNRKIKASNIILSKKEEEKALLLNELNHRVKNNLQMISSLLNIHSSEITNNKAKEVVISSKNRVEALSLVHQKLFQDGIQTKVLIKEYIEELVLNLIHGYNQNIKPEFNIDIIKMNVDKAIPIGLIINELTTNAIKHAFNGNTNPILKINITQNMDYLTLEIMDNGIGFSSEEINKSNTLGLKLVNSLILQLDGNLKKMNNQGAHWLINIVI
ncbi:MAG: tetratricopeptide repeat-containing sensor histidine kinase [Flavobacterium sp.]|jgi:two-component sensor histidine kinase|uniref:tetratricopeptide repeat-containing sensor histidine kinase n=1 Tax=Flavobacterium sp. TaxID=239 RepID=UPI003BA42F56